MNDTVLMLIVVLVAAIVAGFIWWLLRRRRSAHLREDFGTEYDHIVLEKGDARAAEKELRARQERVAEYDLHPIPGDFFGFGSNSMGSPVTLFGNPIANSGGLAWNTDTVVRRLANTGLLSVGSCASIPIEFLALHLESNPFTVSYGGVPSETWKIVSGLSTAAAQPIGSMQICRTCGTGGTTSSSGFTEA